MAKQYDHKRIEQKWQKKWQEEATYRTLDVSSGKKAFVLDMFPYPSGEGLHVGHPKGYIATDVYSRMKRMQGHAVLHPMGWDAFGLPAENYAIKNKVHPRKAVEKNIARFKEQLSIIGLDYDWSREINTTDPGYYKWTQWIFLKLLEKGLAFQSHEPINWCPSCQTGLANEDLEDGKCERCGSEVEKRPMRQWVLRITDYADRLLEGLEKLNWPEHIKEQQRNWIGRKEGIIVTHTIADTNLTVETFSAYPAWMFADTFIVLAPEHPLVAQLVAGQPLEQEVKKFVKEMSQKTTIERTEGKEKFGVFTGRYAEDPYKKGRQMPIWVANFALMDFGTGAIRCSAHDERDIAFAHKYEIPLQYVVGDGSAFVNAHDNEGILQDSGPFTGRAISPELIQEMIEWMVREGIAQRKVTYKIRDWVFSRQRYWGEPIPIVHCEKDGVVPIPENQLPVTLPDVEHYEPTGTGESPLANIPDWVNTTCPKCGGPAKRETNTMPQWAGSCWYYLRYIDPHNESALVDLEKERAWMPVDFYVGGAEHATRHLIYARFWHKFLFDIGAVSTDEPFQRLQSVGLILAADGRKMSKRFGNVVNPDDIVATWGADSLRVYEMFMGPFANAIAWSTESLIGSRRFLEKLWKLSESVNEKADLTTETERVLHQTVKKIGEDIEAFALNTCISQMMIFINELSRLDTVPQSAYETLLKVLAPFAPHITEELWEQLGHTSSIHLEPWPVYDPEKLAGDTVKIVVQVNGKTRGSFESPRGLSESDATSQAQDIEAVKKAVGSGSIGKVIYVQDRLINLVSM